MSISSGGYDVIDEPQAFTRGDGREPADVVLVAAFEVVVALHEDRVVPADRSEHPRVVAADPRPHLAVVEPRADVDGDRIRPACHFEHPEQLLAWLQASALAHREAVAQPRFAAARAKRRLEHQRVVEVGPRRFVRRWSGDRAVTAPLPVEDAAEGAPGVEPRHAAPVDTRRPSTPARPSGSRR